MERRLAAIVCADVAGYSRMMGVDEAGTHATFKAHRTAIYPIILNHGGRLVKNTGDGFLLEFPSVVGAVEAAIAMQAMMAERNHHLPADRVMQFRLGIHMGDVIADEDEVFGDGVNIAVRLEAVAAPGGIAVSAKAYHEAGKHLNVTLVDAGPHRFKNIAKPVYVWPLGPAGASARSGRGAERGVQPGVAIPDGDRGRASVCQSQRRRRRIFLGWPDGRFDPRALATIILSGAQPQLDVHVQGQKRQHAPDRARDRRDLFDPGLGAARRKQDPRHRRTDRAGEWRAIMDRSI